MRHALIVSGNRRDHWQKFCVQQRINRCGVHANDFAYQADVVLDFRILHIRQQHFFHANHAAVFATDANRAHAVAFTRLVDEVDNLTLHIAAQHAIDNAHGVGVGHAHALYELSFDANTLEHRVNLRPATVYHHDRHAHCGQQCDVLRELLL